MRSLEEDNPDPAMLLWKRSCLKQINALHIGPMGFHGNTTALKVQIEEAPTHIAGMPAAVNMCCHACRHWKGKIDMKRLNLPLDEDTERACMPENLFY
jgi:fumarate hydratase subunit alpha